MVVAVVYLVGLGVLVAAPWGWELNRLTVQLYVLFRQDLSIAPAAVRPEHYGAVLNVVLFVPLGALLAIWGRGWLAAALVSAVLSSVVELVQWRWLVREGDVVDVVANTLGGLVGAVLVTLLRRGRRGPGAPGGS